MFEANKAERWMTQGKRLARAPAGLSQEQRPAENKKSEKVQVGPRQRDPCWWMLELNCWLLVLSSSSGAGLRAKMQL